MNKFIYKFSLFILAFYCLPISDLDARFEGARWDYQEANRIMKINNKDDTAKVLYLLKRARNDYLKAGKLTAAEEKELLQIQQALYWQNKMRPAKIKPFRGTIKRGKIDAPGSNEELQEEGPDEAEAPAAGEAEPPEEEQAPEPTKEELAGQKLQDLFNQENGEVPLSYKMATNFSQNNPDDLSTQYMLYSQVLEETDSENLVTEVLGILGNLRDEITDRRSRFEQYWYSKIPGLENNLKINDYGDAWKKVIRFSKKSDYKKLTPQEQGSFKELAQRIKVLKLCRQAILEHDFEVSLPANGLTVGFEGLIIRADEKNITCIDNMGGDPIVLSWREALPSGIALASSHIFKNEVPDELKMKAVAMKVTNQPEEAYKYFWEMMRGDEDKMKIAKHLQDCEQLYLTKRAKPIEARLFRVHASIEKGERKEAVDQLRQLHQITDHPLLGNYRHQIRLIKRKYKI